jgi:general secretion pathway protein J
MVMRRSPRGFTLLELVVAIAVFAVFAALAYGGLRHVLNAKTTVIEHQDAIAVLEDTFVLLESDLGNAVARGARDAFGAPIPALSSPPDRTSIEFTRFVDDTYATQPTTRLKRITYELQGDKLVRLTWPVLDRVQASVPSRRILIDDLAAVSFRFNDDEWVDYWPREQNAAFADVLPLAVEITLRFRDGNAARRILLLGNQA